MDDDGKSSRVMPNTEKYYEIIIKKFPLQIYHFENSDLKSITNISTVFFLLFYYGGILDPELVEINKNNIRITFVYIIIIMLDIEFFYCSHL